MKKQSKNLVKSEDPVLKIKLKALGLLEDSRPLEDKKAELAALMKEYGVLMNYHLYKENERLKYEKK